jgi:hypothetical protein
MLPLPHPSGRVHWWNHQENKDRVRWLFERVEHAVKEGLGAQQLWENLHDS